MRTIDISRPVGARLPIWPGSPGFKLSRHLAIQNGDDANASLLEMDVHTGTHVDAPLHFVDDGASLEDVGLDPFVGECYVAQLPDATRIEVADLERLDLPASVTRLLLRTRNSEEFAEGPFRDGYAALTGDAARWVVDHGCRLIGIDYLSIQMREDPPDAHQILLRADVVIVEGLTLADVTPGWYDLVCLPVRLENAEAAPARAILIDRSAS